MIPSAKHRSYAIIEAPSILGLKPTGVEKLPRRLLELGLARGIGARLAAQLETPAYQSTRDPATLTLNARAIAQWSPRLADALEVVLDRSEDVVAFGFRDVDEQRQYGSQPLPPDLRAFDLETVQRLGVQQAARAAVEHLTRPELAGFFIHLDADCLSDELMPAVEYRLPGGLSFDELEITLRSALASGRGVGLEVTVYNPELDPDGTAGRGLTDTLVRALGSAAPGYGFA
jgi:hypothetical protein